MRPARGHLQRPKGGSRSPKAEAAGGCQLPKVGAGNSITLKY